MKKIILCLTLLVSVLFTGFANSYDDLDVPEKSKETMISYNPGLRLSALGFEPTFSLNVYNLEAEIGCALTTGFDGSTFGVSPNISIGYCTNPFNKGGVTTFGIEYLLASKAYIQMIDKQANIPALHAVSLFYKGGYKFTDEFGVNWRVRLPLLIAASNDGESEIYTITSTVGAFQCVLGGVITIGAGVQFSIH